MIFQTPSDVKKWLSVFRSREKDILLHIRHYEENKGCFGSQYSNRHIATLQYELMTLHNDMDKILLSVQENIRPILSARYVQRIGWDYINLYTYYSRRQAIRLHNKALKDLVGFKVGTD